MGLTCSLLGHAFEDTDVERDREEQGSEVVTIVREVETCRRCGERRTISENKEVTAIVEPDDLGESADERDDGAADDLTTDHPATDADDAAAGTSNSGAAFEPPDDPTEEDAEILDDDGETPRSPGQWPDDDDGFEPTTLTGEPATGSTGSAAAREATEEPPVEESTAGDTSAGDATGSTSAGAAAASDAAATGTVGSDSSDDETPSPEPAATSVPTGDYVCPECGFTTPAAESSLREGDSCPNCRRGYLTGQ